MSADPSPTRQIGEGYKYVALGATFAGGVVVFTLIGFALDRWLGLTPLLTLTGTVGGTVLSFLHVYWKLQAELQDRREASGRGPGHPGA